MSNRALLFLVVAVVALSFAPKVAAFGAGNIPAYSYLEDKAFRHGDIEDIIVKLFKAAGGGFLSRGTKFTPLDVKRVYFGNWLRDYSQAVDVGALKKTNLQTILNLLLPLGFLAHGYVTGEFEITKERLGCYLPTEHIDNPKGYADGEDARQLDPRLRGPVDPRELEIDPQTGMKNYIANEGQGWDTSKSLIRRVLEECIHYGRQYRQSGDKADSYKSFELLGRALHTLEDFTAHSNYCELGLISMGHHNVFPHVGRNVQIQAPNGKRVFPLVTGTFGGADFIHSLLGETTDHLSEASVSDLSKATANARSVSEGQGNSATALRSFFTEIPGSDGNDMSREVDDIQNMRAGQPGGMDPTTMSPAELYQTMWKVLAFRDSVMKRVENTIDRIPGLGSLVEKISNSLATFVLTTIEPFMKPLIGTATQALGTSSQAVIDSHDQYEVWNDWNASDPTHSFLSKDHFGLILNEPAGEIAKTVVEYAVQLVVKAWDEPGMPTQQVTEPVLEALHHPDYASGRSQIQRMMIDKLRQWLDSTGHNRQELLNRLSAESVRAGKNKRIGDTSTSTGHTHNQMLPDGGLQQVLAQHNVHVPGAGVLNAGQDLMGGKMPWDQGFGSGGQHAWRDINDERPNDPPPSMSQYASGPTFTGGGDMYGGHPNYPSQQPSYQQAPPPQPSYGQEPQYGGGPPSGDGYPGQGHHHGHHGPPPGGFDGGYGQQPPYGGGQQGYGGPQNYPGQQQGYGGPPPPPPQGQWGQPQPPPYGYQGQGQGYGGPPGGW